MSFNQKIRKLDVFKKVPQDLAEGTNIGGIISIITFILIVFFSIHEIYDFLNPETVSRITSDMPFTRAQMTVYLDIQFPRFPCQIISLDLQDVMMSHHPNIGSVKKWRLDSNGNKIDSSDFEILREPNQQKQYEMAKTAFQNQYGCRLEGSFTVKEVPGNFHVSSHSYQNIYVRLAMDGIIDTLDVSHKIHKLHFGDVRNIEQVQKSHDGSQLISLHGHNKIYQMDKTPHSYTSHYHLDIVPTRYLDYLWNVVNAYQYTYNHNSYEVGHMPSLYFNYHIGGLSVSVVPRNYRTTRFLLRIFAVLGGIYTLASFIDHMIHQFTGSKHQYELLK